MATPLDITALQHFTGIFPFLLVLILVYAILTRTPIFKERQGMAALIAVLAALMTLFSQIAIKTINMMAPWFVLFIIFGILMMLAYMSFGISEKTVMDVITGDNYGGAFSFWVLSIMLIIGLGSLFTVINEQKAIAELAGGEEKVDTGELGFWQTLFHPKVLGMIVVLLIAFFTIGKMASSE
ncbi:MAG TPA: hypothetical protein VI612_04805 [Candidatus Nanoarchaeia archaeon]|nr:hypothetical protein [Candidatus Nanoarchaeia archaeon]